MEKGLCYVVLTPHSATLGLMHNRERTSLTFRFPGEFAGLGVDGVVMPSGQNQDPEAGAKLQSWSPRQESSEGSMLRSETWVGRGAGVWSEAGTRSGGESGIRRAGREGSEVRQGRVQSGWQPTRNSSSCSDNFLCQLLAYVVHLSQLVGLDASPTWEPCGLSALHSLHWFQ